MKPQEIISKLRHKLRNGLFLFWLFDQFTNGLARLGLTLSVSIVYREGVIDTGPPVLKLKDCTWGFADAKALEEIAGVEGYGKKTEELAEKLVESLRCFALRHDGRTVAFTWCQLGGLPHRRLGLRFGPKDAYLFDAHTAPAYRGMNILPFLRCHLYEELRKIGWTNFYSGTEVFNKPARRFKTKISARPLTIKVYLRLFERFERVFTLYRFDSGG